jgi:hypothetical protein
MSETKGRMSVVDVPCDIRDPELATKGALRTEWAGRHMPVLRLIGDRFDSAVAQTYVCVLRTRCRPRTTWPRIW